MILTAFLTSCVVGTLVWFFIFVPASGMLGMPIAAIEKPFRAALVGVLGAMLVAGFYALVPTAVVVICAEARALCSLRFYLLCGAFVGFLSQLGAFLIYPLIFFLSQDTPSHLLSAWLRANLDYPRPFLAALGAAMIGGAAAGAIYWWIAGCTAGRWRSEEVG